MINLFTDWVLSRIMSIWQKRVLSISPVGAMSHAPAIYQLQWCYPVIVYTQHLVMVYSSSVPHAAIGMVQ